MHARQQVVFRPPPNEGSLHLPKVMTFKRRRRANTAKPANIVMLVNSAMAATAARPANTAKTSCGDSRNAHMEIWLRVNCFVQDLKINMQAY